MNVLVASGKGGTGKTTVACNIAHYLCKQGENLKLFDADVEEPNLHLFIKGEKLAEKPVNILIPQVIQDKCTHCGKCAEVCRYNAIAVLKSGVLVFPELCHSCGACVFICPEHCIIENNKTIGKITYYRVAKGLELISGELNISEPMPTPVIKKLLKHTTHDGINIIDAAPGTGCSFTASVYFSDIILLVTENSPFGLYDLSLAYIVVKQLNKQCYICINKYLDVYDGIDKFAEKNNITVLSRIPEERRFAETYSKGELLIETYPEFEKYIKPIAEIIR
ncbi:MAG: ATP-binding protein [Candidatus Hydrogenedentota bacterium]